MINCKVCGGFISYDWSNLSHICEDCKKEMKRLADKMHVLNIQAIKGANNAREIYL